MCLGRVLLGNVRAFFFLCVCVCVFCFVTTYSNCSNKAIFLQRHCLSLSLKGWGRNERRRYVASTGVCSRSFMRKEKKHFV